MKSSIRTFLFLLASASVLNVRADVVDNYIDRQMQLHHIPGLSLAVVRDGEIIKARGYGLANIETKTHATPETVYQLASVTKTFTATAILLLVQDGKLGLHDRVGDYMQGTPDTWGSITIRHLLSHTSGIKDYLNELQERTREDTTPDKIVGLVAGLPLNFAPGERFSYSNTGYVMLAMIVKKVSGRSYDAFLAERVFRPLGMNATRRSSLEDIIPNRAGGYRWAGFEWQNSPYLNPTLWDNGDGGIVSTALDLAKCDAALYGDKVLSATTKQIMWSNVTLKDGKPFNSALGWGMDQMRGHHIIEANGGRPGTSTNFARYVDDKITVILLANSGANIGRISRGVARHYIPSLNPAKPIAEGVDVARLIAYTGRYEFASNFMLTITMRDGRLVDQSPRVPGGYWYPTSETTFFSDDLPVEITFDRDAQGKVVGLTWKTDSGENKIPRVGPLIRDLEPQADPNPGRTGWIRSVLEAIAKGGRAVDEVANMTPGARKAFGRSAMKDLAEMQSLSYLDERDIAGRGVERHGAKVGRVLYYKCVMPKGMQYLLVHLTSEGLFTDMDVVDD